MVSRPSACKASTPTALSAARPSVNVLRKLRWRTTVTAGVESAPTLPTELLGVVLALSPPHAHPPALPLFTLHPLVDSSELALASVAEGPNTALRGVAGMPVASARLGLVWSVSVGEEIVRRPMGTGPGAAEVRSRRRLACFFEFKGDELGDKGRGVAPREAFLTLGEGRVIEIGSWRLGVTSSCGGGRPPNSRPS